MLNKILSVGKREFYSITSRYSVILLLIGGIFAYGFLYNFMYEPNVVRDAPVAVVDMSNTKLSREYARLLDATPQAHVISNNSDIIDAKELLKKSDATGIVYIPYDFDQRIRRGEQAVFVLYSVTTVFLYYVAMQESAAGAMLGLNNSVTPEQVVFLPQQDVQTISQTKVIPSKGVALFNYTDGYGTYLIPGVLIVIIFQTIMMLVSMLSGKEYEEMEVNKLSGSYLPNYLLYAKFDKDKMRFPTFSTLTSIVIGKCSLYSLFYSFFIVFMLGLLPLIFHLPHLASPLLIGALMIPFILSTCLFALSCSIFFKDSDASLLLISFFSVGLIFLSGISYPLDQMPWYWQATHFIFPAAPATLAFVKVNSMGADFSEISQQILVLWIQCMVFFWLSIFSYRKNLLKWKSRIEKINK